MSETRAKLDAKLRELEELQSKLTQEAVDLYSLWCREAWGVGVGDVVVSRNREAVVVSFCRGFYNSRPWLLVRKRTKDGWAKDTCTFYDWTKPEVGQ